MTKNLKVNIQGNPEPSLSKSRIKVKCAVCGKAKSINMFEYKKNTTGNFYCSKKCLKSDFSINNSGQNNHFFGKKHTQEAMKKISGENHWNYGNRKHGDKVCSQCGKVFNNRSKYCCKDCSYTARRKRVVRPCVNCGKPVERLQWYEEKTLNAFCSYSCNGLYNSKSQPKGKDAYWYGQTGEGTPNWRGGLSFEPYAPDFNKKLKRQVRERDNFRCQVCNNKENGERLHCHHIDYDKRNNAIYNLVSLCRSCHCKTNGNRTYYEYFFKTLLFRQEGATTIPQGSTPQANGGGSAGHPYFTGDDIVCSSRKLEAAP